MTVPPGISIAFDDNALVASPSWTRLDNHAGVHVQHVRVQRGRPSERDKTSIGTAMITGVDSTGVLDPTNASGAFYSGGATKINPTKQISVALQNPTDSSWTMIYRGFAADWNYDLHLTEKYIGFEISCEDALGILSDAEMIPTKAGHGSVPAASTGDVTYDSQNVDDRIRALLADAALSVGVVEWPAGLQTIFSGNVICQASVYSPRTSILQGIDEAADAEFPGVANRFISKGGSFTFHGRLARFNPADYGTYGIQTWKAGDKTAFAGDSSTALISSLQFTRGKENLINAALATPANIPDADIAGQFVSDSTSIGKYGARSVGFENLITAAHVGDTPSVANAETETLKFANYYKDNYASPRNRVSQITLRPQGLTGARAVSTWALICGVELSDVVTLTTSHIGGGGFSEDFFVEGITYDADIAGGTHFTNVTLTLDLSPKAYYATDPFA